MLLNPPIGELRAKVDNRYSLVILVAKRSRDLIEGRPRLVWGENGTADVPVSLSAQEIMDGLIKCRKPNLAADAKVNTDVKADESVNADFDKATETIE